MSSWAETVRLVQTRAGDRCEYCRMHQALQGATFHVEHIAPSSLGGPSTPENLAIACPGCNLHKSDRVEATDPETGQVVRLFNPRIDKWADHFRWEGHQVVGRTPIGRTTVAALDMNHPRRVRIRQAEQLFQMFPP
jgi:HNH endonuclease